MKKMFLVIAVLLAGVAANAQAMSHGKWEENSEPRRPAAGSTKVKIATPDLYNATEMSESNRFVTFTNLPAMKNGTWAIVTDVNGEVLTQKRVTPVVNFIDVRRLAKGGMYFVTLTYKNKSQKAFVLHL